MIVERGSIQRYIDEIFVHPDWRAYNEKYEADLAIFVMTELVDFSYLIRPVCIPFTDEVIDDMEGMIVGWGLAENTVKRHEFIQRESTTRVLNASYCFTVRPELAIFASANSICGGGEDGTPNTGDSGGGFFVRSGFSWIQYGIISSSIADATGQVQPNSFSLYTNVVVYRNWITETVKTTGSTVSVKGDKVKENVDIICTYEIISDEAYRCSVHSANGYNDNLRVSKFLGDHQPGYSDRNVSEIWFWHGELAYIPDGIGKLFNLKRFWVSYSTERNLHLRLLQRANFMDMSNLELLDVKFNEIEWIDEDSLRDLSNLQSFKINNNKLTKLYKQTFARNPNLKHVDVSFNQLQTIHKDIFKNNLLLEYVSFKDNNLMSITTDFTNFKRLNDIDFRGNKCIDKALQADGLNVVDYQALLNSQCGNQTVAR